MLKLLVRTASSRFTKLTVLLLWTCSMVLILKRGWVWESHEVVDKGLLLERYTRFDIEHTPVFVWLSMILLGYAAHHFRQWSLGHYGLVEIFCGLIGGFVAIGKLPLDEGPAWFGLIASAFVIVPGAGNVSQAVAAQAAKPPKF